MAKQTINLGTAPSGSGGDTPRSAFTKAQANIDELYAALGGSTLPAALPVANGGTGATTVAAALASLGIAGAYTKSNILGVVSQDVGVPTGSIIETGTNTNGRYIKFADGTMVCMRSVGLHSIGPNASQNSSFYSFPSSFVGIPFISINSKSSYAGYIDINLDASTGATGYVYSMVNRHPTATVSDITSMMIAIGRWF